MKLAATMPETTMLEELGRRGQQHRVDMNSTQAQLAQAAGVSQRTIERFETGTSIQFDKFLRILRALRLSDNLDQLIPEASVRPLQLVGAKAKTRLRAHTKKTPTTKPKGSGWVWGDRK